VLKLSISTTMSKRKSQETGGDAAAKQLFKLSSLSFPPVVEHYEFAEKTDFNWLRVYFPRDKRQFFINPMMIGRLSPVLHTLFMDDNFKEAQEGEVCFPDEDASDFLLFLQVTVPFECYPCMPVSASNCPTLLHYAKMWMIDSLKSLCQRFLTGGFSWERTSIEETITLLVAVLEFGCEDAVILGALIGRAASFGSDALVKAGVHMNERLTSPASSLLFLNARQACPNIARGRSNSIHPIPELPGSTRPYPCRFCFCQPVPALVPKPTRTASK